MGRKMKKPEAAAGEGCKSGSPQATKHTTRTQGVLGSSCAGCIALKAFAQILIGHRFTLFFVQPRHHTARKRSTGGESSATEAMIFFVRHALMHSPQLVSQGIFKVFILFTSHARAATGGA